MKIKYNNATIYIQGEVDREKIEEATIIFMKKVQRRRKDNGNKNTSGAIRKSQILD